MNNEWNNNQNTSGVYSSNQQYDSMGAGQGYYYEPPVDESGLFSENKLARLNGLSARIKLSDWLKCDCLMLLNLIPAIGSIAAMVIYIILAFGSRTAISIKTRYQANLIWSAIALAVWILLAILILVIAAAIGTAAGGDNPNF